MFQTHSSLLLYHQYRQMQERGNDYLMHKLNETSEQHLELIRLVNVGRCVKIPLVIYSLAVDNSP